jgi:Fic family protein
MLIPPRYTLNSEIVKLLQEIEASKEVVDSISIPPEVENNIRRKSTLRSSLFSARIEGNELTLDELMRTPSNNQKKIEINNVLKAKNWLLKRSLRDLKLTDILTLHEIAMKGLNPDAGKFRSHHEAIFNSAGIAVYMPPPPKQMMVYLERMVKYANSDREKIGPIKAVLVHYVFEKIHPFEDGSGRVGRLVMQKALIQAGYGMKGLLAFEEYIDTHRDGYYSALEEPEKEVTDYVIFMLSAIAETAKEAKDLVLNKQELEIEDYLLPRRAEIYKLLKEQVMMNVDQISRRFPKVNPRTLRHDLKRLQDDGLIRKRGATRGVYYEPVKK